jgi:serine/threonine protein kinase
VADIERPSGTRRDEVGTRRDTDRPDTTRRDGEPSAPSSLVRLPAELAGRFTLIGELPAQGAESDLLHVRDASGAELVVKLFRRGFTADREVWQKLPTLDSPHVVRILETGHAEGRDYEIIEYIAAGNLRAVGSRLAPALVAEVVAQLAAGLDRLHRAGIVHRDLKPENVLVRGTTPIRLAITDFGLSRVIEQSVVFASSSRTLAYAAPESLSGQVSPARDWWSLGIIVRELLTGRTPFAGMSETAVVDHLATRTVDCDDIADPRMRLLCRGLLTRDPRRRWRSSVGSPGRAPPWPSPSRRASRRSRPAPHGARWRSAGRPTPTAASSPARSSPTGRTPHATSSAPCSPRSGRARHGRRCASG